MHHLLVDHYSRLASPIHLLDARIKILVTLIFVLAESSFDRFDIWGVLSLGVFPVFCALLSRVPLRYMASRLLLASPFMLFIVVFQPFVTPGNVICALPLLGWGVTDAGLIAAAVLFIKFFADILMTLVLVTTTPFERLASAFRWWRMPQALVEVITMMFRYTFVLFDELERMVRTARLRSVALAPPHRRLAAYVRILGTHVGRSFDRAERVYSAMLLRGFRDGLGLVARHRAHLSDLLSGALACLFISGMFLWRMFST